MRVTDDISVSRAHAFIYRDSSTGSYFLTDNKSKFGTLMQVQYPLFIPTQASADPSDSLVLQSGKSLLKFSSTRPAERKNCLSAFRQCCLRGKNTGARKGSDEGKQLVTLDGGVTHFPREFLDMKAFNSDKAMVISDA